MKTILLLLSFTFIFSCKNNNDMNSDDKTTEVSTEELTMEGAWKQISFYSYADNKIVDTIKASDANKQMKMYTKTKVMWSRFRETDSIDVFVSFWPSSSLGLTQTPSKPEKSLFLN